MSEIKIHIFHIGKVCVAPELPFGGEHYSALKASGVLDRKSKRLWLPVSAYLIECAHGNVLFDCGWHRDMSPHGIFERRAQIRSLGSLPLYFTNQVVVESSAAIDEQLAARGVAPVDWDADAACYSFQGLIISTVDVRNLLRIFTVESQGLHDITFPTGGKETKMGRSFRQWRNILCRLSSRSTPSLWRYFSYAIPINSSMWRWRC